MGTLLFAIGQALVTAFDMFWDVLWPLVLGFALSGVVQALVSHKTMARLLGDDSPRSLTLATLFFADLIVLPVLDIYRRYYGGRVALYILGTFYVTMAAAGYVVELVFGALGLIPTNRALGVITEGPRLNYTSVLNVVFLALAAVLVLRFLRTGGPAMLRMMGAPEGEMDHENHGGHDGAGMDHSAMGHGAGPVHRPAAHRRGS